MESVLARPDIATVFHQILEEQNKALDQQGHNQHCRIANNLKERKKVLFHCCCCATFFQMTFPLRRTGPSRPGPSPASVAHRGAAEGLGDPGTAATAWSTAPTTPRGTTSVPTPAPSTRPIWLPSAGRPRRA